MALRLIEAVLPPDQANQARALMAEHEPLELWTWPQGGDALLLRLLVAAEKTEAILSALQDKFGDRPGFRVVMLPVEAVLPPPPAPEEEKKPAGADPDDEDQQVRFGRISREELYQQSQDMVRLTWTFLVLVALSAVVAAIGVIRDDVAAIIGAMVIAPLLGANSSLSLATTLADRDLALASLRVMGLGTLAGLALAAGLGMAVGNGLDPQGPQVLARTQVGLSHVALALAAGAAGALAFTQGVSAALVGVMVAVALLPPLVTAGLLLGSGHWRAAGAAGLLYLLNLICINLSGVVAFRVQGIRPATWWQEKKSRRTSALAISIWLVLLCCLVAGLLIMRRL